MTTTPYFDKYSRTKIQIQDLETYIGALPKNSPARTSLSRAINTLQKEADKIRNQIAELETDFLKRIVSKYHNERLEKQDLFQEGYQALLKSIDTYDPTFGVPFEAYAYIWIRKSLSQMVETQTGPVRIPDSVVRANRKANAPVHGCSFEPYEDTYIIDEPNAEELHICRETKRFLTCCIDNLDDTRRKILLKRHFTNKLIPLEEVAQEYGISREQTRLLEKSALQDIKKKLYYSKATSFRRTIH